MTPSDDPTWPVCPIHRHLAGSCGDFNRAGWCEHVRKLMLNGEDAPAISLGTRVCVPIIPAFNLFAEVSIDTEEIIPGAASMALVVSEPFTSNETLYEMGMWTSDEGRLSIAETLQDWANGKVAEGMQCSQSAHGYSEARRLNDMEPNGTAAKANTWTLAAHKMCFYCWDKVSKLQGVGFGTFDIDIDPPSFTGNRAKQALHKRCSKRGMTYVSPSNRTGVNGRDVF